MTKGTEKLSPDRRLELVLTVVHDGQSASSVARANGVSRQTVQFWLGRYRQGGAEALTTRYMPRRTKMSAAIRTAAIDLIARNGLQATSLRQIARQLGLVVSSLYNHISSKNSLLFDIVERTAADRVLASREIADIADVTQRFRELVRYHVLFDATRSSEVQVARCTERHLSDDQRAAVTGLRRQYQSVFRTAVREGIRQHVFRDMDVEVTVRAILAMSAWLSDVDRPRLGLSRDAIAELYADLALRAVQRPSRTAKASMRGVQQETSERGGGKHSVQKRQLAGQGLPGST